MRSVIFSVEKKDQSQAKVIRSVTLTVYAIVHLPPLLPSPSFTRIAVSVSSMPTRGGEEKISERMKLIVPVKESIGY